MGTQQPQKPPCKSFRVRSYAPEDHAAVVNIYTAGIHQSPDNLEQIQPHWQQLLHAAIHGDLAHIHGTYFASGGHFWVATCERGDGQEEDEAVVGMVAVKTNRTAGDAELVRMFVHPMYHRCGIGRLLVGALEQWAADEGFARVWLSTANAQRFYVSIGYKYVHTKTHPVGIEVKYFEKHLAGSND